MDHLPLFTVQFLCLLSLLVCCYSEADQELLPYEPVQYLKTHLPAVSSQDNSLWKNFLESSPQEAGELTMQMKKNLKAHLAKTGTSVVFAKGERILVQRRTSGMKWDTKIVLPYANTISLMSVALPILLENYKSTTIRNSIGDVLKGDDRNTPIIEGHETESFLDILNTLPTDGVSDQAKSALKGLESKGKVAIYFANKVLDISAQEAWLDALMSLGMADILTTKEGQLIMNLNDFLQYSLTIMHELSVLGKVPKSELFGLDNDHYLFGWWINCPIRSETCLLPLLPADTMISLSPSIRMYVIPSLELTMIITAGEDGQTIRGILDEDEQIWNQIYSVLSTENSSETLGQSDASSQQHSSEEERRESKREDKASENERGEDSKEADQQADEEVSDIVRFIHWIWPPLVFLFWVTASHVWVYYLLHGCWFVVTRLVKRTHIPRPKTAADVGQN